MNVEVADFLRRADEALAAGRLHVSVDQAGKALDAAEKIVQIAKSTVEP